MGYQTLWLCLEMAGNQPCWTNSGCLKVCSSTARRRRHPPGHRGQLHRYGGIKRRPGRWGVQGQRDRRHPPERGRGRRTHTSNVELRLAPPGRTPGVISKKSLCDWGAGVGRPWTSSLSNPAVPICHATPERTPMITRLIQSRHSYFLIIRPEKGGFGLSRRHPLCKTKLYG